MKKERYHKDSIANNTKKKLPLGGLGGFLPCVLGGLLLFSCTNVATDNSVAFTGPFLQYDSLWAHSGSYSEKVEIKYAKGLKVDYREDGIHVFISNPDPKARNSKTEEVVIPSSSGSLPTEGSPMLITSEYVKSGGRGHQKKFICTTALQLGNFEVLGMEERIVGMNSLKNVFSPKIKQQLAEGKTVRVGKEGNFDLEAVIASKPDYIFVSASKYGGFESLKECGIPLISHHGYRETDPLGQAEWIKLIGLLTGETQRANAVFEDIESKYNAIKAKVAVVKAKRKTLPTILSGRQIRDGWYVMGGKSYMARIFADAGVDYIMTDIDEAGGTALDFESVYAKGINADFWQIDGTFDDEFTLNDLTTEDARYGDIKAYKNQHVLFCNFAKTPYRELGGLEPHRLLSDFVKAFYPEVLPNYTPKYYKLMK